MSIKSKVRKLISDAVRTVVEISQRDIRESRNVDLVLQVALREALESAQISDAVAYVELIRTCIGPLEQDVVTIKEAGLMSDMVGRRFATSVELLRSGLPPIPLETAIEIAKIADRYRGLRTPIDLERWSGDAGLMFEISSSFGRKGRILASIIRICRPERCLELGTAFGMSAIFMMEAYEQAGISGHLVTIEGGEPQFSLAAQTLRERYNENVVCHFGMTYDVLPNLSKNIGMVNFLFHDAAHSGDDYINDFNTIVDVLAPGAIMLLDDIRWEDVRFHSGPARTYEGWRKVVDHPRVQCAAEIGKTMGLALLR